MANTAENVREFYRRQGEEREQQRIVHLLEKITRDYPPIIDYIALIKGENQ